MGHAEVMIPTPGIRAAYTEWRNREMLVSIVRDMTGRHADVRNAIEAERIAWRGLERVVPIRTGWYRIHDHVLGWAKRDAGGLQLVVESAFSGRMDRRRIVDARRDAVRHILGGRRGGTR